MDGVVYVKLWGTIIGVLGYEPGQTEIATFEYDKEFLKMGISPSPLKLSIESSIYSFENISQRTFHGLPGFIADSLPDKFGNQLIDQYFADKGVSPDKITTLDRLLYVNNRAIGALEYEPSKELTNGDIGAVLNIEALSEIAETLLLDKEKFRKKLHNTKDGRTAMNLLRVGSSAGGARSKALVAMDNDGKLYDGTIQNKKECRYFLLKFDSNNNSDRDNKDPKGITKVEYIYSLIAKECGIDIPYTTYIETDDDFHFLIERFDRVYNGSKLEKIHYVSWSGMAHADRDSTGTYSYEQLVLCARELGLGQDSITEIFKRAVFNIVGRNQDDHAKNFGFLMDRSGKWRLSPAFDMTYSYDPTGKWTKVHQIKLNSKQSGFNIQDIYSFGKLCNISKKQATDITKTTVYAFKKFENMAIKYKIDNHLRITVIDNLRIDLINELIQP